MQQVAQMHKIRQQHQNFSSCVLHNQNNNNNNLSHNNNNGYHHQPPSHPKGSKNPLKQQYTQQQQGAQDNKAQGPHPKYLPPPPHHQAHQQHAANAPQTQAAQPPPPHMAMIQQQPQPPPPQGGPHATNLHTHNPSHYHHHGGPPQYYAHQPPAQSYHLPPPNAMHAPPGGASEGQMLVAAGNTQPSKAQQQMYMTAGHHSATNNGNMHHYAYATSAAHSQPSNGKLLPLAKRPNQRGSKVALALSGNNNNYNSYNSNYNNNKSPPKSAIEATPSQTQQPPPTKVNLVASDSVGSSTPSTPPKSIANSSRDSGGSGESESCQQSVDSEKDTSSSVESVGERSEKDTSKNDRNVSSSSEDKENVSRNSGKSNRSLSREDMTVTSTNGKEKTPMCLVNELARFNKIVHQYRLTSEDGPAHSKRFTVTLKLGEEEYTAEGFKIKKAQHLAAAAAIERTKYKHPTPKFTRRGDDYPGSRPNITPTVELNALAMKLGQQTFYVMDPQEVTRDTSPLAADGMPLPPPYALGPGPAGAIGVAPVHMLGPHPPPPMPTPAAYMRRGYMPPPAPPAAALLPPYNSYGRYGQRGTYHGAAVGRMMPRHAMAFAPPPVPLTPTKITLYVGNQKFVGSGRTLQHAKHDAASKALEALKAQQAAQKEEEAAHAPDAEEADAKSPISLVHELAIRRGMTVLFKVLREEGPAHMKNFVTACICGSTITEGEGNGKRISKKRAAEKMLVELRKLPAIVPPVTPVKRGSGRVKGKPANADASTASEKSLVTVAARKRLDKEPVEPGDDNNNPITCLIQLQQTRKEKEPEFVLIGKNGNETARRRQFIYEVSAQGATARGLGSSKKLAKRSAAENLLKALGIEVPVAPDTVKKEAKSVTPKAKKGSSEDSDSPAEDKTASEETQDSSAGQVPGILILRQPKKKADTPKKKEKPSAPEAKPEEPPKPKAEETTPPPPAPKPAEKERPKSGGVQSKQQLLYLAKILDFEVSFSDYPKGNHNEFLTIVTLTTNPPQICHGVGADSEESQNDASRNALRILSDLGIGGSSN